jgi:carboxyl-terminal processing protease
LTILRPGKDEPFDVTLVRAVIRIQAVKFEREGDIGYVRISSFNEKTFDNLKLALTSLNDQIGEDMKGYILDLRNNPGGLLDQAISVSDAFLDRGEVVSTRGRNSGESQRYSARDGDFTNGKPIVVLINGGSASASEIVAGALRDHERAKVIGTRSFGKGSVQTIIPLGSQGALRLTTARYYTPSGTSIQATGIVPDIVIEQELPEDMKADADRSQRGEASLRGHLKGENGEEASGSSSYVPPDKKDDKQLQAAIDLLHGKTVKPSVQKTVDQQTAKGATSPVEPEESVKN